MDRLVRSGRFVESRQMGCHTCPQACMEFEDFQLQEKTSARVQQQAR